MKQILQKPISPSHNRFQKEKATMSFFCLLLWIIVGSVLRFYNLEAKTVWSDEWSTIVFSLGHSFRNIPLDTVIDLPTLLQLVRIEDSRNAVDTIANLMTESTHPPLYFVLSHWWLKLFASDGALVSIWQARSLSAVLGVLSIPLMFSLGWLVFESILAAQIAAALMAVSPYGIYLAQEARHYTLAILWVIASLSCWIITLRYLSQHQVPRRSLMLLWILVNSLGMATHYFFGLNLLAQALVLLTLWLQNLKTDSNQIKSFLTQTWRRIGFAMLGTLAGCSVWIYRWQYFPHDRLTNWTHQDFDLGLELLSPIARLLAWLITMFVLPPIEGVSSWITVVSVIVLLPSLYWFVKAGWQHLQKTSLNPIELAITRFLAISLALNLIFAYFIGRDITLAARFQFFYFPLVLILGAGILDRQWQLSQKQFRRQIPIVAILVLGCLGGLVIVSNYGFQKSDRPDLLVPVVARMNQNIPLVITTVYRTHGQAVETIGLAWEWQKQYHNNPVSSQFSYSPQFLLLKNDSTATDNLHDFVEQSPRPFDLWLVNFSASTISNGRNLSSKGCLVDPGAKTKVSGYRADYHLCKAKPFNISNK
ncbi:MAG: hypothetical protein AAF298_08200 [Cyanobacteria bacterium P01_A01_bin.40]